MSLPANCPSCNARVTAPDRLAGKTVKCPKCQSAFVLPVPDPGFEVIEDDAPVVAKPRVKPPKPESGFSVVVDDEPVRSKPKKIRKRVVEEDEEPEWPRRRSSSGSATSHTRLFVALGGGLLFLGIVAVGIYLALDKVNTKPSAAEPAPNPAPAPAPTPAPVEWKTFTPPNVGFSVSLPGTPTAPQGLGDEGIALVASTLRGWELTGPDMEYKILVITLSAEAAGVDGAAQQVFETQLNLLTTDGGANGTETKLGKYPARQYVNLQGTEHTLMRAATVGTRVFFFIVSSKTKPLDAATEGVSKYFDSVVIQ